MNTNTEQNRMRLVTALIVIVAVQLGVVSPEVAAMGMFALAVEPYPITPELTAVAVAYRNSRLIADGVLPRVLVTTQEFKYLKYPKGTFFTVPDTKVGRRGVPNEVELEGEDATATAQDHGLDDVVPNADIQAAASQPNLPDPLMKATEFVTDLVMLAREKRAADLVFDSAQYAAANKVTLAGNDQWSVDHADSDPIADITAGLDACVLRPNIMVIGRLAWTKLSMHKKIVGAIYKAGTDAGIASRQAIADLFELDEILVGEGFINTAKKGQTPTISRVWGKHCVLAHRNPNADTQRGVTFGITAQWGSRVAGAMNEQKTGLRGSQRVRVGESVKELLTANDLAYMVVDCVA
jgi:hypothetical protein